MGRAPGAEEKHGLADGTQFRRGGEGKMGTWSRKKMLWNWNSKQNGRVVTRQAEKGRED